MIRAKLAELRHIVVFMGPFCSFSTFEFFVLRSGASEYLYENFREYSSFIFRFNGVFKNVIDCVVLDVAAVFVRHPGRGFFGHATRGEFRTNTRST